jgi:hypothetical protein
MDLEVAVQQEQLVLLVQQALQAGRAQQDRQEQLERGQRVLLDRQALRGQLEPESQAQQALREQQALAALRVSLVLPARKE